MKELEILFEQYTRQKPENIVELPSSGSNRRYFRITGSGMSLIGAKGLDVDENIAFMEIAKHFKLKGLPVPQVLCASEDNMFYLQEDLGDITLFNTIQQGRETSNFSPDEVALLKKTISTLPKLQFEGGKGLDYNICFPQPEFDERNVWFDCNYFKYCFLKTTGIEFSEIKLHDDLTKMAADLLEGGNEETFMYRDFQARNVMLVNGNPYFIDFQGGRKGPLYYDLASFVWQAKANYPTSLKEELIETYREALKEYVDIPKDIFYKKLRLFVLFRTMQVLGAYGFRGYFEKKPHFLQSVPFAIDNLRKLIQEQPFDEYPYIQQLLEELTTMRQFSDLRVERKLEVRIFSFSYKKGIPVDTSGNGGGYVFDCRAINNPGKYDHFKHFTGLDKEVIEFLEEDGEVTKFLSHVYELADAHVTRYMERKFTNLMFSFGCTGGQHRSVYCAQHLAEYLAKRYNITVKVYHREQDISQEL